MVSGHRPRFRWCIKMAQSENPKSLLSRERQAGDLVFAIAFLLFSAFLLSQLGEQTRWVKGTKLVAQPAFWPAVGLIGMTLFAGFHFLGSLLSKRTPGRGRELVVWARSLEYAAWFLVYVWLVPQTGYLPTTIVFVAVLMIRLGYRSKKMILGAVAVGIAIVVIFKGLLEVKIPGGQVYEYLPDAIRNFMLLYL